jgi:hypothetical protein
MNVGDWYYNKHEPKRVVEITAIYKRSFSVKVVDGGFTKKFRNGSEREAFLHYWEKFPSLLKELL